jgi:hypothetical protein
MSLGTRSAHSLIYLSDVALLGKDAAGPDKGLALPPREKIAKRNREKKCSNMDVCGSAPEKVVG